MNIAMRPVLIAGANGARSSVFSGGVNDVFSMGVARPGWAPARPTLGQSTDQQWFEEAKQQVGKYDTLVDRLRKIANKQVREQMAQTFMGDPANPDSGLYRRNSVASDVAEAESFTPVNYFVYGVSRRRNRVTKLREITHDMNEDVRNAEATWGSLPAPQIIERVVEVQVPGEATPIVPILIGGAAVVGVLALLGVFGGQ